MVDSGTVSTPTEASAAGLSTARAVRLGLSAGLCSHLPWLALSRIDALRPLAVAMLATFWFLDPWLAIPLYARLREARTGTGDDLRFGLAAGLVAGTVAGATTLVWERGRTSAWLPFSDVLALLVYPAAATAFAAIVVRVARTVARRRRSEP